MGVIGPIVVLNVKVVIVASATPLARVCVSNISAGMIQQGAPTVELKL